MFRMYSFRYRLPKCGIRKEHYRRHNSDDLQDHPHILQNRDVHIHAIAESASPCAVQSDRLTSEANS
jgi:hypothetical protein